MLVVDLGPFYPKGEGRGAATDWTGTDAANARDAACFGLSDEGIEAAGHDQLLVYDSQSIRRFVGIDWAHESTSDATTRLRFRRLFKTQELTRRIFETISAQLPRKGLMMREGAIVDATLMSAQPSTQEAQSRPRPADTPGQERQALTLRHEGTYQFRC